MEEVGIDIAQMPGQLVSDVCDSGEIFAYVIPVCHESDAQGCPVFPGAAQRLHWLFEDPAAFTGTEDEKLERTRAVRDAVKTKIEAWCCELAPRST